MSHSQRLTSQEVRAAFHLVREACELGEDANVWRSHVLDRLDSMVHAATTMLFVGRLPFDPASVELPVFVVHRVEAHWLRYRNNNDLRPDPCTSWIVPRLGGSFTEIRQRMCDDRTWYTSDYFNQVLRPIRQDHYLVSAIAVPEHRCFSAFGLTGRLGDRPFDERSRQLVRLIHEELALLWRTPPLSVRAPWREHLSPRLEEVLSGLLDGLSEKQIAARLGLRRATVHNHVSRLHEALNVSSRGELLAKARPRPTYRPALLPPAREPAAQML